MRKEDKYTVIEEIGKALQEYSCLYLTETTGLNAEKTSALRRACFNSGIKLFVVKNTLLKKAMEQSDLPPFRKRQNSIISFVPRHHSPESPYCSYSIARKS